MECLSDNSHIFFLLSEKFTIKLQKEFKHVFWRLVFKMMFWLRLRLHLFLAALSVGQDEGAMKNIWTNHKRSAAATIWLISLFLCRLILDLLYLR